VFGVDERRGEGVVFLVEVSEELCCDLVVEYFGCGGVFLCECLVLCYVFDLGNMFGNLVNCVIVMLKKYFDGKVIDC
jgi:hypothetical protein